ncbi:MAG: PAS domain S-box protein, partial [Anaerolineales bacterium]
MILSYITTNLVCAIVMALLWLQNRKRFAGIGFWFGQYVAIFMGFVLFAFRGVAPDFLSIVIANALIVYGILSLYMGLERFVGKAGSQIHNYIVLAVFIFVHAWFTYLHPSLLARNINVSVCMFIFASQIAWFTFRRLDPVASSNIRNSGVIAILICLISLARILIDLTFNPGNDFLKTSSDSIVILFYQILQIALTLNLFLQVNGRLVVNLENDMVKRQRAEQAVRASETLYRQMFASHSAVMLLVDPESGAIVEANQAAVNFYGYPANALQQMSIQQVNILPPEESGKLRRDVQTGKLNYLHVPHRLASGEIRQVEVHSVPIEVNQRALLYSIIHDVTEREQAEEALKESEARYRAVSQSASDAIVTADSQGNITGWNGGAEAIFGYPDAEIVGQPLTVLMPPRFRDEHLASMARVQSGGESHVIGKTVEIQGLRKSGGEFPLEMSLAEWQVGEARFYTAIIRNITERKQAEEALEESRKVAEELFEFTPDALLMVDETGSIMRVNQQTQNLFGYAREELLNLKIDILIPQRFHAKHAQDISSFFAQPHMRPMGTALELFAVKRDGREFPVDILLSPLQLGGKAFVTAAIRDISERKQAEEALRQTQAQVVEQQRALATLEERERVARELHDGIGQILGYVNVQAQAAQTLLGKNQPNAAQKNLEEIVQVAQDAHANLRHTILGLRDSAPPQRDFIQALQACLDSFHQAWGIETVFSPPQAKLPVLPAAVEDQLLHIVQEALVNIRKHAAARRVEVLISLQPGEMTLIVSDDGRGFDPQLAPGAEQEHFGLGIMRERAGQLGGRVEIRSGAGNGTKVLVYVPTTSAPASAQNPKDVYSLRILLVDDQPLFLDGMRNLLAARGLTVIATARDGLEACEQVKALRPDVVLMDVQMPNCDGIEATRRIKAEFPETQVVLLTVSEDDEHLLDAVKYGAAGYLLKSLDANQLFSTLDRLARGEIQIAPQLAARLLSEFNRAGAVAQTESDDEAIPAELTARQWEALRLVARGLTYKEAGRELGVTEAAIKYHMAQLLERLQLKNREQAVAYLRQVQA